QDLGSQAVDLDTSPPRRNGEVRGPHRKSRGARCLGGPSDPQPRRWAVECGEDLWSGALADPAAGEPIGRPRAGACGRLVWDGFASGQEAALLRRASERAFEGLPHQGLEVSLVPGGPSGGRLGPGGSLLVSALQERCRVALEASLAAAGGTARVALEPAGALLKRLRLPAEVGALQAGNAYDPFAPHADRANVAAYEFSPGGTQGCRSAPCST
ncbi:unnamed protein product, partial [Prorocentrum cordatum]